MFAQDFYLYDVDGEGEMQFLLHFYNHIVVAREAELAIRYGASVNLYKGIKCLSQQQK